MFGELFAEIFNFELSLINKVKVNTNDYYSKMAVNSSMDISKIKKLTGITPKSIEANFKILLVRADRKY